MSKNIAFYITNHGYGHASRNVAIIEELLTKREDIKIWIKTDAERVSFLQRNLYKYDNRIIYNSNYHDVGFILNTKTYKVDVETLYTRVSEEIENWPYYIKNECNFLVSENIDLVVSDVIPWVLLAAKKMHISSILLCNFTWYEMYKEYLPENLCLKYYHAYNSADKIYLYTLGNPDVLKYFSKVEMLSLISRKRNSEKIQEIYSAYKHPIIFVSVGKSITMEKKYNVSGIEATFLTTTGVELEGENVVRLPSDMINTQDYISASDYVISKTGWSSLAEIFLNKKKAAVILRGDNPEDNAVLKQIEERGCGVICNFNDLNDINSLIEQMDKIDCNTLDEFHDDLKKIVDNILELLEK